MEEAEMADTTTEPTTTTTAETASSGATQTGQGTFVQPTTPPAAPTPADVAANTTTPAAKATGTATGKTADPAEKDSDDKGKGSKDAVLADLARERDERQKAQEQLTAVLEALGINQSKDADPEQLAADLQAQRAENAVLRAGQGIADVEGLLDSKRFTDSLTKVDVTDTAAVKAHIEAFVTENPRYAPTGASGPTPGVRDAAVTPTTPSAETDWLRAAIQR